MYNFSCANYEYATEVRATVELFDSHIYTTPEVQHMIDKFGYYDYKSGEKSYTNMVIKSNKFDREICTEWVRLSPINQAKYDRAYVLHEEYIFVPRYILQQCDLSNFEFIYNSVYYRFHNDIGVCKFRLKFTDRVCDNKELIKYIQSTDDLTAMIASDVDKVHEYTNYSYIRSIFRNDPYYNIENFKKLKLMSRRSRFNDTDAYIEGATRLIDPDVKKGKYKIWQKCRAANIVSYDEHSGIFTVLLLLEAVDRVTYDSFEFIMPYQLIFKATGYEEYIKDLPIFDRSEQNWHIDRYKYKKDVVEREESSMDLRLDYGLGSANRSGSSMVELTDAHIYTVEEMSDYVNKFSNYKYSAGEYYNHMMVINVFTDDSGEWVRICQIAPDRLREGERFHQNEPLFVPRNVLTGVTDFRSLKLSINGLYHDMDENTIDKYSCNLEFSNDISQYEPVIDYIQSDVNIDYHIDIIADRIKMYNLYSPQYIGIDLLECNYKIGKQFLEMLNSSIHKFTNEFIEFEIPELKSCIAEHFLIEQALPYIQIIEYDDINHIFKAVVMVNVTDTTMDNTFQKLILYHFDLRDNVNGMIEFKEKMANYPSAPEIFAVENDGNIKTINACNHNCIERVMPILPERDELLNKKEKISMKDMLNFEMGKVKDGSVAIAMNGRIAIKGNDGKFFTYDDTKSEITDVSGFTMGSASSSMIMYMPVQVSDIKVGDIIRHNGTPKIITEILEGFKFKAIDISDLNESDIIVPNNIMNMCFVTKYCSFMDMQNDLPGMGTMNPMMIMLMMNDSDSNSGNDFNMKDMMMMQMMQGGNNSNMGIMNPMMIMLMMNDSDSNSGNDFNMKDMMMMQMMQGESFMPFMPPAEPAPIKRAKSTKKKNIESDPSEIE